MKVNWLHIILTVAICAVLWLTFGKSKPPIDNTELIKEVRQQRDYFRNAYDSVISMSRERDTVLITEYKTLYEKNKTIRPAVTDYDKERLRTEINNR